MLKTKEQLLNIWFNVSHIGGWIRILEFTKDYDQEEIKALEEIDQRATEYCFAEEKKRFGFNKKHQEIVQEFKKELPADEIKEARLEFLNQEIKRLNSLIELIWKDHEESIKLDVPYWLRLAILDINNPKKIEGYIRRLTVEKLLLEHPESYKRLNRVSPEEIARALTFPFDQLIEFNKTGFAFCPFHNEKKPSFHLIKQRNKGHCFGCQWNGNVINFLMDRDKFSFKDAVRKLSST